jgi:hypothetical protein
VPPCVVWFESGYACVQPACANEADEGRAMQRAGRWYTRCPVACSRHQRLLGAKSGITRCSERAHTLIYPRACLAAPAGQQGSHQLRGQRFLPKMCVTWAHLLKNDPNKERRTRARYMTGQRTRYCYCLYIPSLRTASAIESGGGTGSSGGGRGEGGGGGGWGESGGGPTCAACPNGTSARIELGD